MSTEPAGTLRQGGWTIIRSVNRHTQKQVASGRVASPQHACCGSWSQHYAFSKHTAGRQQEQACHASTQPYQAGTWPAPMQVRAATSPSTRLHLSSTYLKILSGRPVMPMWRTSPWALSASRAGSVSFTTCGLRRQGREAGGEWLEWK